jgi:hypothetical protein
MKKHTALSLICLACLAWVCGCAGEKLITPGPTSSQPAVQPTPPPTNPILSNIIGDIIKSPGEFDGKTVEIVGYFRGWDLLDEAGGSPPVTRSDWVIADNSGAIYVTGLLPKGLDPASKEEAWTVIRLAAIVTRNQSEVYLEAQSIDLITKK